MASSNAHTCSEQSLRILMWNASYEQKHSNYTWQEMGRWRDPRKIEKVPSPCPVLDEISWQIAKTVQIEKIESKFFGNGMVVLGLATSHVRQWSRYVTKASLRHITMERQCLRWWMTARPCIHTPGKIMIPCLSRGFTSIQMFHTHTHQLYLNSFSL